MKNNIYCSFCGDKIEPLEIYYYDRRNNKNYCETCLDIAIAQGNLMIINKNGNKLERSVANE